ncbi:uncharacterized protein MELLADRAFT_58589 [Melampsora larici-populina 98AG31]|uniref:PX-associated domain-containing protein n=1 Tax=Melampsora larici-populina (strain 98AG31 / pathotype 3-4-7) TaxID=747676 RepID=F4R440_MELLP|nr:uncharacterized protein MELLADRAFT_58589 [Melampsora larici-populina 98AG31]EGG13058.1 hypothetical protein MELLADRAFT_58589 [Melampsora larici-populina 98AG31]
MALMTQKCAADWDEQIEAQDNKEFIAPLIDRDGNAAAAITHIDALLSEKFGMHTGELGTMLGKTSLCSRKEQGPEIDFEQSTCPLNFICLPLQKHSRHRTSHAQQAVPSPLLTTFNPNAAHVFATTALYKADWIGTLDVPAFTHVQKFKMEEDVINWFDLHAINKALVELQREWKAISTIDQVHQLGTPSGSHLSSPISRPSSTPPRRSLFTPLSCSSQSSFQSTLRQKKLNRSSSVTSENNSEISDSSPTNIRNENQIPILSFLFQKLGYHFPGLSTASCSAEAGTTFNTSFMTLSLEISPQVKKDKSSPRELSS